jgi:hypothetical protein
MVIGRQAIMGTEDRRRGAHACECAICEQHPFSRVAKEHRRINRLVAGANERNRRLLVGFLAEQQGQGGVALMSRITGLSRTTILRGRRELHQGSSMDMNRVRQRGGGRKRVEKKGSSDGRMRPGLKSADMLILIGVCVT